MRKRKWLGTLKTSLLITWRRDYRIIVPLICILLSACAASVEKKKATRPAITDHPQVDDTWSLADLEGRRVSLSEFNNQVIFLNIWATWCPPCLTEMPTIEKLYRAFKDKEVNFVIASPEGEDVLRKFLEKHKFTFPVYRIDRQLPEEFTNQYIPRTYIIDRFGKIVYSYTGESDWNKPEMHEFVSFLLKAPRNGKR